METTFKKFKHTHTKTLYDQDSVRVYFIGSNHFNHNKKKESVLHFKKNKINLKTIVPQTVKSTFTEGTEESHAFKTFENFILSVLNHLDSIENELTIEHYLTITSKMDHNEDNSLIIKKLILESIAEKEREITFSNLLKAKPYPELFKARKIKRNIIVYEAPTNSGKTYTACKEIVSGTTAKKDKSVCMFPLRALAAQIKDDFMKDGIKCSLITGEEKEIVEDANIESITTEILSVEKKYKMAFIDESQLLFDAQRGPSYARAIIGTHAETIMLAVAPAYKDALLHWLEKAVPKDNIIEKKLERLCPLHVLEKPLYIKDIEKGDLIVTFSVKEVHYLAERFSEKYKVGVLYGKMSPTARRAMIRDFMGDDYDILIATDAIGMGLSIPAKRVLFSSITKYDGITERHLTAEEIRQVAGRAGRFGFYDEGYCGVFELEEFHLNKIKNVIRKNIISEAVPQHLTISPDKSIFNVAKTETLKRTIELWERAAINEHFKANEQVLDELREKAAFLDSVNLDKDTKIDLLFVTFPKDKNDKWLILYKAFVTRIYKNLEIKYDELYFEKLFNSTRSYYRFNDVDTMINYFEDKSIYLTLISQFQRIYPEKTPKEEDILLLQNETGERLNELLKEKYASLKK